MSEFKVEVVRIDEILPIEGADRIERIKIKGYEVVSQKGNYEVGDYAVYIPEAAIVPKWILDQFDFKLAGAEKNRVKAIKLRGVVSQGILIPVAKVAYQRNDEDYEGEWAEDLVIEDKGGFLISVTLGQDLSDTLEIKKWEPEIPTHMAGNVWNAMGYTHRYDVENIKNYPDALVEGEEVSVMVKLHGTHFQAGYYPKEDLFVVASKGIAARGLAFKLDDEANANNLYVKQFQDLKSHIKDSQLGNYLLSIGVDAMTPVTIFGEIAGPGVQKGFTYGNKEPELYIFDIYIGKPGQGRFLNRAIELRPAIHALSEVGSPTYWLLPYPEYKYVGPWDPSRLKEWTDGKNKAGHVEEGVVICAERSHRKLGDRILLKSISDAYLLRGGETTEYN